MKLFDIGIPYTVVNADVLLLHSRIAILEMLRLYGGSYALNALQRGTPYHRRKQADALRELQHVGLVSLDENNIPAVSDIPPYKLAEVPTYLPWDALSLSELKVTIALYVTARYGRSPYFSYEGRHDELSKIAQVSREAVGLALSSLAVKGICTVKPLRDKGCRWTRGTLIQLMDPASGAALNDLGWFFRNRLNELDVLTRYKLALKPQLDYHNGFTAESGMRLTCPLCLDHNRTLRLAVTESTDRWSCFHCGRSGDSTKLCALRSFHLFKEEPFNMSAYQAYLHGQTQEGNTQCLSATAH